MRNVLIKYLKFTKFKTTMKQKLYTVTKIHILLQRATPRVSHWFLFGKIALQISDSDLLIYNCHKKLLRNLKSVE